MRASLILAGTALVLGTGTALSAQQSQPSGTAPPAAGQPATQDPQATPPADQGAGAATTDPAAAPTDPSATATDGTADQQADKKKKKKKQAEEQQQPQPQ